MLQKYFMMFETVKKFKNVIIAVHFENHVVK